MLRCGRRWMRRRAHRPDEHPGEDHDGADELKKSGSHDRLSCTTRASAAVHCRLMSSVVICSQHAWDAAPSSQLAATLAAELESGRVVFCPQLEFAVEPHERSLFTPAILGSSKNTSYDPLSGRLG